MSITVYPYKLSLNEMEVRLDAGVTLLPGQLLRFEAESPVFGEVTGVRLLSTDPAEGYLVRIHILHGVPSLDLQTVVPLTDEQMAQAVQALQAPISMPLRLGTGFTGEFERLGALSLIEGDDLPTKYETMMALVQGITEYGNVLIVDPLGLFSPDDPVHCLQAGPHVRLSLQEVGSKRFLTALSETFPDSLKHQALPLVAGYLPVSSEFSGFHELVKAVGYEHSQLRNLLLQSLQRAAEERVFADSPEQTFSVEHLQEQPASVLDLSGLNAPWKGLFYEEACRTLFRAAPDDLVLVLIYPEHYLGDVTYWVHLADEAGLPLVVLASPYPPDALRQMADNLLLAESVDDIHLEGELTLGLPVMFALGEREPAAIQAPPPMTAPEAAFPDMADVLEPPVEPVQDVSETVLPEPEPAMTMPPLPEPESEPDRAAGFDSILGTVPETEEEEDDFHFDVNLDHLETGTEALPTEPLTGTAHEALAEFQVEPATSFTPPDFEPPEPAMPPPFEMQEPSPPEPAGLDRMEPPPPLEPPPLAETPVIMPPPAEPPSVMVDLTASGGAEPTIVEWTSPEEPVMPPPESAFESTWQAPEEATMPGTDSWSSPAPVGEWPDIEPLNADQPTLEAQPASWAAPEAAPETLEWTPPETPAAMPEPPPPAATLDESQWVPAEASEDWPIEPQNLPQSWEPEAPSVPPEPDEPMPIIAKAPQNGHVATGFKVGDRVRHPSYGSGLISKVIPMEETVILNITFDSVGKRLLDPSLCQLEKE